MARLSTMTLSLKRIRAWGMNRMGFDAAWFWIWSAASVAFDLFAGIVSLSWWTLPGAVAFCAGVTGMNAVLAARSSSDGELAPKEFLALKKTASYFAFAQFCFQSMALIMASSAGRIDEATYYAAYAVLVLVQAAYLPVFFRLNARRNLVERGLMEKVAVRGRTKFRAVTLYRGFVPFALSWIDAIVWAVSAVIFVNSLVFQLYEVPTESMVPEMYDGTRVFTLKTFTNPEIPLSLVKIPVLAGVRRFDRIVLGNPRYPKAGNEAISGFLSDFVARITFTLVKMPRLDEYGEPISDPLIKRLIGMPGDQLLMADDVVYRRGADGGEWKPLAGDGDFAYNVKSDRTMKTERLKDPGSPPFTREEEKTLLLWDSEKNALSIPAIRIEFQALLAFFRDFRSIASPGVASRVEPDKAFRFDLPFYLRDADLAPYLAWQQADPKAFLAGLTGFMKDWEVGMTEAASDPAASGALGTNLLFKLKFATLIRRYFEARAGMPQGSYQVDLFEFNRFANLYIQKFYDARNFAAFPGGSDVLGTEEYFFIGDNRYNSLDCRNWSANAYPRALCAYDPYSPRYWSIASPFSIDASWIRGKAYFTVF